MVCEISQLVEASNTWFADETKVRCLIDILSSLTCAKNKKNLEQFIERKCSKLELLGKFTTTILLYCNYLTSHVSLSVTVLVTFTSML